MSESVLFLQNHHQTCCHTVCYWTDRPVVNWLCAFAYRESSQHLIAKTKKTFWSSHLTVSCRRFEQPLSSFSLEHYFINFYSVLLKLLSFYLSPSTEVSASFSSCVAQLVFLSHVAGLCWWGNSRMLWQLTPTYAATLLIMPLLLCPRGPALGLEGRLGSMNYQEDLWYVLLFTAWTCTEAEIVQTPTCTQCTYNHLLLIKYVQAPQDMCTCVREVFSAYVCFCLMSIYMLV